MNTFLSSHSGKGVVGVALAALLFVWPPACSWIMASLFLGWAISHLNVAFRELDLEKSPEASEQLVDAARRIPRDVRPLLVGADSRRNLPGGGGDAGTEFRR